MQGKLNDDTKIMEKNYDNKEKNTDHNRDH